ncbi:MAG: leucine efflux protein LeuE [Nocardioides sp.]|nr:leucine efflux protein LeuE [Nocardioides sp.]
MDVVLGITDLSTYLVGLALIILLPGPNSLYVLSVAARLGPRAGYQAAGGVFTGDAVLMLLAAGGVASLLNASPLAFAVVKYAGAAYLAWLAFGLLRGAVGAWRSRHALPEAAEAAVEDQDPHTRSERPYRRALVISLLNPKAILFFVSFFVQFVDPDYAHPALSFLFLATWAQLFSFVYLSTLIFGGHRMAQALRSRRRLSAGLTTGVAAAFLGFAVKLTMAGAV